MNCQICDNPHGKYKCPVCCLRSCSMTCFKVHKNAPENCVVPAKPITEIPQKVETTEVLYPTEHTVSSEALHQLKNNEDLKRMLKNPHLRDLLIMVNSTTKPKETMQKVMLEPIFVEFAESCLKTVENNNT